MTAFAQRRMDCYNLLRRCACSASSPSQLSSRHAYIYISTVYAISTATSRPKLCNNFPRQIHQHQIQTRHFAGHNKWSKIKRKKASNDVARAKEHSKAARAIEAASRACQGDLDDIHLQSTISAARAVQLPKERVEKAIERGANPHAKSEGEEYAVRRYDGMIPTGESGKIAVIIETLTENKNRTAANVRHLVTTKAGGELLPTGANDWMFEHVGLIWVSRFMGVNANNVDGDDLEPTIGGTEIDPDALLESALEGGATDVEFGKLEENDGGTGTNGDDKGNNYALIKCEPNDMLHLIQRLKADGYTPNQFENQWLVKDEGNRISLEVESAEKFEKFMSSMDDDLDVTNVFHNASFDDGRV